MEKNFDITQGLDEYIYDEVLDRFSRVISSMTKSKPPASLPECFMEGGIKQITLEIRYRSQELRQKAIEENGGLSCSICGFNFEDTYGDYGKGYIEVHHKIPLHDSKINHFITTQDVVVVCANCHSVLHHKGETPIDIDELKDEYEKRKKHKEHLINT